MARSSILGTSPAPQEPAGRNTASLGPGDSSDSGSDMMGIADSGGGDSNVPADFGPDDLQRPVLLTPEALNSPADAAGTGETRSAASDGGENDGWDIGVDRVFTPGAGEATGDEDAGLASVEEAEADDAQADAEAEDADSEADAEAAAKAKASQPRKA